MTRLAKSMAKVMVGLAVLALAGSAALAEPTSADQPTPKGWNYEIKDGKRVPKGDRVTNPDGSWHEQIRQGNCTTLKDMSASGELKITRKCD